MPNAKFNRSEPAFFQDPETKKAVDILATHASLTIYAGLGATIDKSGVDWTGLVRGLLKGYGADDHVAEYIRRNGPMAGASVATEFFRGEYSEKYGSRFNNELRRLLYKSSNDIGGRLSDAVASLAVRRQRRGLKTTIITPNFDNYLEQSLKDRLSEEAQAAADEDADEWGEDDIKKFIESRSTVFKDRTKMFKRARTGEVRVHRPRAPKIALYFIHGYVPEDDHVGGYSAVLSESDYYTTELESGRILEELIGTSSVLIIGSSLSDPPLLRALHATMTPGHLTSDLNRRLALLPLQGPEWAGASQDDLPALMELTKKRLEHFGLSPLFPDFFFQVAQFAVEVDFAGSNPGYSDPSFTDSYGDRIGRWWTEWWSTVETKGLKKVQVEHHAAVAQALRQIRWTLRATAIEPLKLEVWLRWKPTDEARKLRLWASSTGIVTDLTTMRDADTVRDSEYASMRIFCEGRPRLMSALSPNDRWRSYFGTPLYAGPRRTKVPIGIVTLASQYEEESSSLSSSKRAAWPGVVELMRLLGEEIQFSAV